MNIDLSRYFREYRLISQYDEKSGKETIVLENGQVTSVYDKRGNNLKYFLFVLEESEEVTDFDPSLLLGLLDELGKEAVKNTCIVVVKIENNWETNSIIGLILPNRISNLKQDLDPKMAPNDTLGTRFEGIHIRRRIPPVILKCSVHPDLHPKYVVRSLGPGVPKVCKIDNAPLTDK